MEDILTDISRFEGMASYYKQKAEQQAYILRQKLLKGETTGDPICDFVLLQAESLNKKLEAFYKAIEQRLNGQIGSFIALLVQEEDTFNGQIRESFYLGILRGEKFLIDIKKKECAFNTKNYSVCIDCDIDSIQTHPDHLPLSQWWKYVNKRLISTSKFQISIKTQEEINRYLCDEAHFHVKQKMKRHLK